MVGDTSKRRVVLFFVLYPFDASCRAGRAILLIIHQHPPTVTIWSGNSEKEPVHHSVGAVHPTSEQHKVSYAAKDTENGSYTLSNAHTTVDIPLLV